MNLWPLKGRNSNRCSECSEPKKTSGRVLSMFRVFESNLEPLSLDLLTPNESQHSQKEEMQSILADLVNQKRQEWEDTVSGRPGSTPSSAKRRAQPRRPSSLHKTPLVMIEKKTELSPLQMMLHEKMSIRKSAPFSSGVKKDISEKKDTLELSRKSMTLF